MDNESIKYMTDVPKSRPSRFLADLRRVLAAATPRRRFQLVVLLILTATGAVAELVTIGAVLPVLAIAAAPDSVAAIPLLGSFLGAMASTLGVSAIVAAAILLSASAIAATVIRLMLTWVSQKFIYGLQQDLVMAIFGNVLRQPYDWYLGQHSSLLISSLEKIYQVTVGVVSPLILAGTSAAMAACVAVLLFVIDPGAAVVAALTIGGIYVAISVFTQNISRRASTGLAEVRTARVRAMQETLGGIRDIILDHSQPMFEAKVEQLENRYRQLLVSANMLSFAPRLLVEGAAIVLVAAMAAWFSLQPGGVMAAIPVLGALALGAQRLLPMVQAIYLGYASYAVNRASLHDVLALLETPRNPARALDRDAAIDIFRDRIELRDVGFAYADGHQALHDIELTIRKGERIGLIGKTGSGKSTLVDIMMGLLSPTGGALVVDSEEIGDPNLANWKAQIAHVPQAIFLADGSIARNIAFADPDGDFDMDRVSRAARIAQLDTFAEALPHGYDTMVGERGVRLSGGQRQRLGLARAIYKQAPVLLLDEATSALDDVTEQAVLHSLDELGEAGCTILIVAHRASTITSCDEIVRIDDGRIVDIQ